MNIVINMDIDITPPRPMSEPPRTGRETGHGVGLGDIDIDIDIKIIININIDIGIQ